MSKNIKVVAIIQARMSSSRLPGKVLIEIVGKPVLWHIVNRLREAKRVDKIVIASPKKDADKPIMKFAQEHNIDHYEGSERDLLDRIYQAAKKFGADVIVLITADCPLIDPAVVDMTVKYYLDNSDRFDCVSTGTPLQTSRPYPDGLDTMVFSFNALEKMWKEVKDPFWREWFAANFCEHPGKYRHTTVPCKENLPYMRWTLDYEDDLEFITEVYKRLYREDRVFLMEDVLELLGQNPELMDINKGHIPEEPFIKALETRKGGE